MSINGSESSISICPIKETCSAMSRDHHEEMHTFPKVNIERYQDPTPYAAVHHMEEDKKRVAKLANMIRSLCSLCGFHIQGHITFVDDRTGKSWMQ